MRFCRMNLRWLLVASLLFLAMLSTMQAFGKSQPAPQKPEADKTAPDKASSDKTAPAPAKADPGYSGMYSFTRDGEFVQITVEEQGRVTGFVSRYGDAESATDRGEFLDHFFKQGKLDGNLLTFSTETVGGTSFEFRGKVERGEGKNPGDEAYFVLTGLLTKKTLEDDKKISSHSHDVTFRSFPQDLAPAPPAKN